MGTFVVMADVTLARLGCIAEQRWGLFTTAQATAVGVARKQLSRMTAAGAIERIAHGVYRMAGAPPREHETIYATWLVLGGATSPRTENGVAALVAAGATAAAVHNIGDFLLDELDYITPTRKDTRLPGVRLRIRHLAPEDVLPVDGLPTLTVERTIADLIDLGIDRSLVAGSLRDAARAGKLLSADRLVRHLEAISRIGSDIAADLFELAGIYQEGLCC